ncbi:MAG: IS3 family transposase, partial [Halothiobacillaceae bacterium]
MYRCIDQLRKKAEPVAPLCRVLGVSRSGYYASRQRAAQPQAACPIRSHLQVAFAASGKTYGSRRLVKSLKDQGFHLGRYRVRSLMKAQGLRPVWKRKFIHTTDSRHRLPVADNVLDRQFTPPAKNTAWVSDITCIRTQRGW